MNPDLCDRYQAPEYEPECPCGNLAVARGMCRECAEDCGLSVYIPPDDDRRELPRDYPRTTVCLMAYYGLKQPSL